MQVCRRGELGKEAINTVFGEHRGAEGGWSEQVWQAERAGRRRLQSEGKGASSLREQESLGLET